MANAYAALAFTPAVRAEQAAHGSVGIYGRVLGKDRNDGARLGPREAAFLEARDGIFQATVGETGWPYVQFRGGAPGFLKVIDPQTVAYADYRGNRQYISTGNLRGNDRVSILAIDFAARRRLKLLGRARITEDPSVIALLAGPDTPPAERAVVIRVAAHDWNCSQHIPLRRTEAEHGEEIARLRARIAELEETLGRQS
ncbi:pyridoxamine 5'-phosphate oxidase family protein [Pseudoponticoccus marisrubri]|uniref:Pyridoxamine 5'-phosphate oxidase N-terminal domain-containing protein n=1 Tax=Pseudoponticoccus marisrubri TaxID=1685382 RepID=A0A0W7WKG7_9RHOB|nr:pyridoxamine 5'-phosphate oxidase family protein [Pseudoponticoccus marisrubri]KUF11101.1 hypothetical protein AVJ23_08565 [Pseudoponticoccus marisrubri]